MQQEENPVAEQRLGEKADLASRKGLRYPPFAFFYEEVPTSLPGWQQVVDMESE
jgi:hypothetical protein